MASSTDILLASRWWTPSFSGKLPMMRTLLALSVLIFGCAALLSGCAAGPYGSVVTRPPEPSIRLNGQPKLLPCMIGDLLCTPQQ